VMECSPWRLEHFGAQIVKIVLGGLTCGLLFHGAAQTVTGVTAFIGNPTAQLFCLNAGYIRGGAKKLIFVIGIFLMTPRKIQRGDSFLTLIFDHSGNLPHLIKNGYIGPIYATHATADLVDVMFTRTRVTFRKRMRSSSIKKESPSWR